jgi:hypothetical protein
MKKESERLDRERQDADSRRRRDTRPSRPLAAYAGVYDHPAYGPARVMLERDRLVFRWGAFAGALEHHHFDTFHVDLNVPPRLFLTFALSAAGDVLTLDAGPPFGVPFTRGVK